MRLRDPAALVDHGDLGTGLHRDGPGAGHAVVAVHQEVHVRFGRQTRRA